VHALSSRFLLFFLVCVLFSPAISTSAKTFDQRSWIPQRLLCRRRELVGHCVLQ
jgi:hypothetical protein